MDTPKPASKDWKTQIYTQHEFDPTNMNQSHYTALKTMFEGDGAWVSKNKFIPLENAFVGGLFLLGSNDLPNCAKPKAYDHDTNWKPILARVEIIKLENVFDGETEFPYTALDLASALQHLINQFKVIEAPKSQNQQEEIVQEKYKDEQEPNPLNLNDIISDVGSPKGIDLIEGKSDKVSEYLNEFNGVGGGDCGGSQMTVMMEPVSKNDPFPDCE